MEEYQGFLSQVGSSLRVWVQRLDQDFDQKVSAHEFTRTIKNLGYSGDVSALLAHLDTDKSGELSLEELDAAQAELWQRFRMWCTGMFKSSEDMMQRFIGSRKPPGENDRINHEAFVTSLEDFGWPGGHEDLLYTCLEADDDHGVAQTSLRWLDMEKRRQARKEKAKQQALQEANHRNRDLVAKKEMLVKFKSTLKRTYGSYVRAWRRVLSPNDTMVLQKTQFFASCSEMGWSRDVRMIWKAFGKVGHGGHAGEGSISIEDVDPKSAETLAHFCKWIRGKFGDAAAAFREFDKNNKLKVHRQEFLDAVYDFGFTRPAKVLFHGLDKDGKKALVLDDIKFLDYWNPPAFLLATPNAGAVDHIKALLLNRFRNYLKAWRRLLDKDSSNRCAWKEFHAACASIGFSGDVPGAWRTLDHDLSGYITLGEIDPVSAETLNNFREWACREFGSVRSALSVFNTNKSHQVTSTEFKRSCRIYGYEGNAGTLFRALDVERDGLLSMDEVAFLDDWEVDDGTEEMEDLKRKSVVSTMSHIRKIKLTKDERGYHEEQKSKESQLDSDQSGAESQRVAKPRSPDSKHSKVTVMPSLERGNWNDGPNDGPRLPTPTNWKPLKRKANMWCSICKARGLCIHMADQAQSISRPNSSAKVRSRSLRESSKTPERPRAVSSLSARSPRASPSWAWAPDLPRFARKQAPQFSQDDASTRFLNSFDASVRFTSSMNCFSSDAEVQYSALRHFPMGSVSPVQATASLHMLSSNMDILHSVWSSVHQSSVQEM